MKHKNKLHTLVTAGGSGPVQLNQHAPKFADKRTKRNKTRGNQKRRAIQDGE